MSNVCRENLLATQKEANSSFTRRQKEYKYVNMVAAISSKVLFKNLKLLVEWHDGKPS